MSTVSKIATFDAFDIAPCADVEVIFLGGPMNSVKQVPDTIRAVSAANISQLTFFVMPDGRRARAILPAEDGAESEIAESLKNLGFDIDREVGDGSLDVDLWADADSDSPLREAICPGATLFFSEAGIAKLIAGGVSTPTLNALKGKALVRHHPTR
jgi:hypothetical protein